MTSASNVTAKRVFVALVLLSLVLLALIVQPFVEAFILAAVLAGALSPLHTRVTRWLGKRPRPAAAIIVFLAVIVLVVPIGAIMAFLVREAAEAVRYITQTLQSEGVAGLVQDLPPHLQRWAQWLLDQLPQGGKEISSQVGAQSGKAAAAVGGLLSATGTAVVQITMMLIALYFFLLDGDRLVTWIEDVSPMRPRQVKELLEEFRKVSVAVLVSTVATSGVQAAVALIGYLIAGVPQPVFFAAVTFFIAFIPAVGAGGACLAAAGLVLASGRPWHALFLALWGVIVVGLIDNVIKPLLVKRGLHLHGGLVFFALLGGLAAFGPVGLVLGPVIVAFFLALVRIYDRDFGGPDPMPLPPLPTPTELASPPEVAPAAPTGEGV